MQKIRNIYIPQKEKKIPCSVGILTYNSAATLERCLKSLNGFDEIIVADGGSSDATIEIAEKYGCRIIKQSNPGHSINDFSLERNRLINASSNDWFFYIDSDEYISQELKDEMQIVCSENKEPYIYRVPWKIVNAGLSITYRSFKTYYQHRFFNKKSGALFDPDRKIHERIIFDKNINKIGTLNGCWYVPLDSQLVFSEYKRRVDYRIRVMVKQRPPKNLLQFLRRIIYDTIKNLTKQAIKFLFLRFRYPSSELVPAYYEFYKLYSQGVSIKENTLSYFSSLRPFFKTGAYLVSYTTRSACRLFNSNPEVVVLMYHSINSSVHKLSVRPEHFERHIKYLSKKKLVAPLKDVVSYAKGEKSLTAHTVAVTFDDGYKDFQTTALPILEKYNIPATIFVPSDLSVKADPYGTERLSEEDIRSFSKSALITIGSHSKSHTKFTEISYDQIKRELLESADSLQALCGERPFFFTYPFGARSIDAERAVKEMGYSAAFGITEGLIHPGDDLFRLKRIQVDGTMNFFMFRARLTSAVELNRKIVDTFRIKMKKFISRCFNFLIRLIRREDVALVFQSKEKWDNQFANGAWDRLTSGLPNTKEVAKLITDYSNGAERPISIIDVGCGNGGLAKCVVNNPNIEYTGMDISDTALSICKNSREWPKGYRFISCDAENPPDYLGTFDIMVFNEVFFYINPDTALKKYKKHSSSNSLVIISITRSWRTPFLFYRISRSVKIQKKIIVKDKNLCWDIVTGKFV
jgi:peptidoglycan/xylan/chitin deacetylase (PgdA/CDA1 family)/SAM-dependent methyltransferase